jgi:hypothetical protein
MKIASTPSSMKKAWIIESLLTRVQIAWFQWEFLRRNEDYKKDYAAFESRFREWFRENGNWFVETVESPTPLAKAFFRSEVAPAAKVIMQRWGISEPVNPASNFDVNTGNQTKPGMNPMVPFFSPPEDQDDRDLRALEPELSAAEKERISRAISIIETMDSFSSSAKKPQSSKKREDYRFIEVRIDITESLESTFQRVGSRIEEARDFYRVRVGCLPDHRRKPRLRLDQYNCYLKAWDLRKQGKTFEEIAREMFPREMQNAGRFSPAIKKARSHYKRACELVAGGYRQIEA